MKFIWANYDKNVSFISDWLNSNAGIEVKEVRIIPDIKDNRKKYFRIK